MSGARAAITVTLPLPPKELSPNARTHYMVKAAAARSFRLYAGIAACGQMIGSDHEPFGACRAVVQVTWPDKRRRDLDNLLASLKSAFDGFTDAGVWEDDARVTWEIPPARVDRAAAGVTITITERGGA